MEGTWTRGQEAGWPSGSALPGNRLDLVPSFCERQLSHLKNGTPKTHFSVTQGQVTTLGVAGAA